MRADGHGVEPICGVLCEQRIAVAPRSYRSWTGLPACERDKSDAAVLDTLRDVRTGGPKGRPLPEVLYGRRKMTAWLGRNGFPGISKHTVDPSDARRGYERPRPRPSHPHHDPRQDRRHPGRRPAQSVFQTPHDPITGGSPTSPTCRPGPASSTSRSRSTCTPGRSWAGPRRPAGRQLRRAGPVHGLVAAR
jgi:hypothetical protein